jgi:CheY-like chemotaxis protein
MEEGANMPEDFSRLDGVYALVVEDSDDSREALRVILEHCGALVTTARTANEAHRILALLRPDVLVTDTTMPQTRLELVRSVQALAQVYGIQIPTIAMTDSQSERAKFWAAGVAEVLVKPLDATTLCRAVRRLVTQD